jgi:CheY-like chemotaxis protein
MPKKILLIENDAPFASKLTSALESQGFEVRTTADGREALELARDAAPAAIVLCVELPGMSGYVVCQKLRKDETLRAIPLVLTSADATPETFEKHKSLKAVRADAYLLKPFAPQALVDALATLVGLPEPEAEPEAEPAEASEGSFEEIQDEELVSLEEEMGLEALSTEPVEDLPALDLSALPDEPVAVSAPLDEDLKILDDAFEELAAPASPAGDDALELDLGLGALGLEERADAPAPDPVPEPEVAADEDLAPRGLDALEDETDAALGALVADDDEKPAPAIRGASADALRAAGIRLLDDDAPPPTREPAGPIPAAPLEDEAALRKAREALARAEAERDDARERAGDAERRAGDAERSARDAEGRAAAAEERLAETRGELEETTARVRALEASLEEARLRAEAAEADARKKTEEAAAAADAISRADALEAEVEGLKGDLAVARSEVEGARGEVEKRTAELRRRVHELEATSAKHEERVVKAYQKIKADEKVRDKVRKALAIASQLLEEGLPQEPSAAEKERRAASLLGRE